MGSLMLDVQMRPFQPGDEAAFRSLNEKWITKDFVLEEPDRLVLGDPVGQIIEPGGHIFVAIEGDTPIGCCALLALDDGGFEVAKMAVKEDYRGRGIGRRLLEYTISRAKALGARRLYLESGRKLANAVHLYESVGFRHLPPERVTPSPYARSNVFMEMLIR